MLAALLAGVVGSVWEPPPYRRWPWLTLAIALLSATGFALQTVYPEILTMLARDRRILSDGEVWRPLTALFVQDGGSLGFAFNAFALLTLGTTAERRFTRAAWLAIYFGGGLTTELLALAWQPHGAGNSIACLALAGALCSDWRRGTGQWGRSTAGLAGTFAAGLLLLERDIHGIGFFAGLAIGWTLQGTGSRPVRNAAAEPSVRWGDETVH